MDSKLREYSFEMFNYEIRQKKSIFSKLQTLTPPLRKQFEQFPIRKSKAPKKKLEQNCNREEKFYEEASHVMHARFEANIILAHDIFTISLAHQTFFYTLNKLHDIPCHFALPDTYAKRLSLFHSEYPIWEKICTRGGICVRFRAVSRRSVRLQLAATSIFVRVLRYIKYCWRCCCAAAVAAPSQALWQNVRAFYFAYCCRDPVTFSCHIYWTSRHSRVLSQVHQPSRCNCDRVICSRSCFIHSI